jgi:hypothetical protein
MEQMFLVVGVTLLMLLALLAPGREEFRRPQVLLVGHDVKRRAPRRQAAGSGSSARARSRLAPRFRTA